MRNKKQSSTTPAARFQNPFDELIVNAVTSHFHSGVGDALDAIAGLNDMLSWWMLSEENSKVHAADMSTMVPILDQYTRTISLLLRLQRLTAADVEEHLQGGSAQ